MAGQGYGEETRRAAQDSKLTPTAKKGARDAVVGIALGLADNNAMIVAGIKGGAPADRSKMLTLGDRLLRIDGLDRPVKNTSRLKSVVHLFCGPVGSIVSLGIIKETGDEVDVVLVREEPDTFLHSNQCCNHSQGSPCSPAIRPAQHDEIQPREGHFHNLYSSVASLPPNAASHHVHSPRHTTELHKMLVPLARLNLSHVESDPGMVYRSGMPHDFNAIHVDAPVVWPQGIRQEAVDMDRLMLQLQLSHQEATLQHQHLSPYENLTPRQHLPLQSHLLEQQMPSARPQQQMYAHMQQRKHLQQHMHMQQHMQQHVQQHVQQHMHMAQQQRAVSPPIQPRPAPLQIGRHMPRMPVPAASMPAVRPEAISEIGMSAQGRWSLKHDNPPRWNVSPQRSQRPQSPSSPSSPTMMNGNPFRASGHMPPEMGLIQMPVMPLQPARTLPGSDFAESEEQRVIKQQMMMRHLMIHQVGIQRGAAPVPMPRGNELMGMGQQGMVHQGRGLYGSDASWRTYQ